MKTAFQKVHAHLHDCFSPEVIISIMEGRRNQPTKATTLGTIEFQKADQESFLKYYEHVCSLRM